jgi:hypothetical protein
MNRFAIKLLVFVVFAGLTHLIAGYHMNGHTDTNYLRFTPSGNKGLIMGNSRAAQAICPDDLSAHEGLFNAAFALNTSPYGEAYSAYLMKQLNQQDKDQFFVFCVDPWSLSSAMNPETGEDIWVEQSKFMVTTSTIADPNWEFILEQYSYGWGNIIREHYRPTSGMYLHKNGWLEVMREYNQERATKRRIDKLGGYKREVFIQNKPSKNRKVWLQKLIREMKSRGKVLMVRIPVHPDFFEMEQTFWPGFEKEMNDMASKEGVVFWSPRALNEELYFNDGHHMNYKSSHRFSQLLNQEIEAVKQGGRR